MKKQCFKKQNHGFTLLDLLVAVIIIGVLAGLAFVRYTTITEKTKSTEGVTMLSTLRDAQNMYFFENGAYAGAGNLTDLDIIIPNPLDGWNQPELDSGPVLATIVRFDGVPLYSLAIEVDGTILCTLDIPLCTKLGFY